MSDKEASFPPYHITSIFAQNLKKIKRHSDFRRTRGTHFTSWHTWITGGSKLSGRYGKININPCCLPSVIFRKNSILALRTHRCNKFGAPKLTFRLIGNVALFAKIQLVYALLSLRTTPHASLNYFLMSTLFFPMCNCMFSTGRDVRNNLKFVWFERCCSTNK